MSNFPASSLLLFELNKYNRLRAQTVMTGILYIVATPIGNLEDITLRALRVLQEADLIACEDTRHTRKLLSHYQISKPLISYHLHNERERSVELLKKLQSGLNVALVSDAGTPLISDPGFRLVNEAIESGIRVEPIPGPAALIAALSASGLPSAEFTFAGFLPPRRASRKARLREFAEVKSTLIFYEAPHRIKETIKDLREVFRDRECVIARELTKVHEEFVRGPLSEIDLPKSAERGEMVLLIGPARDEPQKQPRCVQEHSISEQVEQLMLAEGLDRKEALKRVARARRISKSEAYRLLIQERGTE